MSNPIKYNTSTETLALKTGNFWIGTGDVGKGPTSTTGYYNGITPPSGGYTIYLNKATGGPSIYTCANDTELISLTNQIAGTSYTTANECFNYYNGQTDKIVVDSDFDSIATNGLIMYLDPHKIPSYKRYGGSLTDLSGNGNDGSISSGEFVSGDNYLRNLNNSSNFFIISVANSTSLNNAFSTTTGAWTIEEMIWTNSVTYPEADGGSVVSDNAYSAGNTGFDWNHGQSNLSTLQFGMSSSSTGYYEDRVYISTGSADQLNTWRHRTMIWDRGNDVVKLYMNGTYTGSQSTPNTSGTSIYDGGGITFGSLYGWKHYGRRGFIRVYNRELSSSEVLQNFNATKSRFGL